MHAGKWYRKFAVPLCCVKRALYFKKKVQSNYSRQKTEGVKISFLVSFLFFPFYHCHSATSMSHACVFPSTDSTTKLSHSHELTLIYKSAALQLLTLQAGASILHDPQNGGTSVLPKNLHVLHVPCRLIHFQIFHLSSSCSFLSLCHLSAPSSSSCRKLCWLQNVYHSVAKATNPKGIWYSFLKAIWITDTITVLFFFSLSFLSISHFSSDHLLSDTFSGQDCDSPAVSRLHNNNLHSQSHCFPVDQPSQSNQSNPSAHQQSQPLVINLQAPAPLGPSKRRLSVERSLSAEDPRVARGPEESVAVKPARVYTITREGGMTLGGRGSEESLELEVLKGSRDQPMSQGPANQNPSCTSQPSSTAAHGSHHRSSHHRSHHQHAHQQLGGPPSSAQPLQSSGNANNIRGWGMRRGGSRDDYTPDCVACIRAPCQSQRSLDLDTSPRDGGKHRKKLERMYSEERASTDDRGMEGASQVIHVLTYNLESKS